MRNRTAWVGWLAFAGVMLLVTGAINAIEGIVALANSNQVVIRSGNIVYVDLTGWGWTALVFGLVMIAIGVGLLQEQTWARIAAIVVVGLHAVAQVLWIGAYPLWSLLMITLDTVVIFALTARWQVATRAPVTDTGAPVTGTRGASAR